MHAFHFSKLGREFCKIRLTATLSAEHGDRNRRGGIRITSLNELPRVIKPLHSLDQSRIDFTPDKLTQFQNYRRLLKLVAA
jgi:hypothetical protein